MEPHVLHPIQRLALNDLTTRNCSMLQIRPQAERIPFAPASRPNPCEISFKRTKIFMARTSREDRSSKTRAEPPIRHGPRQEEARGLWAQEDR